MELLSLLASIAIAAPSQTRLPPCEPQKKDFTSALITILGGIVAASVGMLGQQCIARRQIDAQNKNIEKQIDAQNENIKKQIKAQSKNVFDQISLQTVSRLRGRKEDFIVDKVILLLDSSDPDLNSGLDYQSIVSAVHSIQLFLDLASPYDLALNEAIISLACAARSLLFPSDDEEFVGHLANLDANGLEIEATEAQTNREEDISSQLRSCQAEVINATQKLLAGIPVQQSQSLCDNSPEAS